MNKLSELLKDADPFQHESDTRDAVSKQAARRDILAAASAGRQAVAPKRYNTRIFTVSLVAAVLLLIALVNVIVMWRPNGSGM